VFTEWKQFNTVMEIFDIFTAVSMNITKFLDVMACNVTDRVSILKQACTI
jgi:hypothetical protein